MVYGVEYHEDYDDEDPIDFTQLSQVSIPLSWRELLDRDTGHTISRVGD